MVLVPPRTRPTISARLSFMALRARISWAVSSRPCATMRLLRSPAATFSATATASRIGAVIERPISQAQAMPSAMAARPSAISSTRVLA